LSENVLGVSHAQVRWPVRGFPPIRFAVENTLSIMRIPLSAASITLRIA
jgi:hypothetical protein